MKPSGSPAASLKALVSLFDLGGRSLQLPPNFRNGIDGMNDLNLTRKQAAHVTGLSTRTLQRYEALDIGPPMIRVGPRSAVYPYSSLTAWLAARYLRGGSR